MKKIGTQVIKRLSEKTARKQIENHLQHHFKFSPAMAEVLTSDSRSFGAALNPEQRDDDQIIYQAVSYEEHAGKPLKTCKMVPVILSVYDRRGTEIKEKFGMIAYRKYMIEKLTAETELQGATLTHEDLATLLHVERKSIGTQIAGLRMEGKTIKTRASYTDSGRGVSHKSLIVKLYLLGMTETMIGVRSSHALSNVESYIKDFLRVSMQYLENKNVGYIVRMTNMTPKLVEEYIKLYQDFAANEHLKDNLQNKIKFYQTKLLPIKKKAVSVL